MLTDTLEKRSRENRVGLRRNDAPFRIFEDES